MFLSYVSKLCVTFLSLSWMMAMFEVRIFMNGNTFWSIFQSRYQKWIKTLPNILVQQAVKNWIQPFRIECYVWNIIFKLLFWYVYLFWVHHVNQQIISFQHFRFLFRNIVNPIFVGRCKTWWQTWLSLK